MYFTIRSTIQVIAVLAIQGCSINPAYTDNIGYQWEQKRTPIDRDKWEIIWTEPFPIQCRESYACAIIKQHNVYCHMYIPHNAPEWVLLHEQQHCLGWNHQSRTLDEIRRYLP